MPEPDDGPTVTELILHAESMGYPVTAEQIADWRRLGLLPFGARPGRGPKRGRGPRRFQQTVPAQLIALCRIHQTVRDLGEVGWWLWWEGWDVPEQFWRPAVVAAAVEFDRMVPVIRRQLVEGNTAELTDLAFEFAKAFKECRTRNQLHRNVRKRLGDAEVQTFVKSIFRLCIGVLPLIDPSTDEEKIEDIRDEGIVRAGLGLQRASVDRLPTGERTLEGSIREPLGDLAIALRFRNATVATNRVPGQLAAEARAELRDVVKILAATGRYLGQKYGRHAFGLGLVQLFDTQQRAWWAMVLAVWISLGKRSQLRRSARQFLKELNLTKGVIAEHPSDNSPKRRSG